MKMRWNAAFCQEKNTFSFFSQFPNKGENTLNLYQGDRVFCTFLVHFMPKSRAKLSAFCRPYEL